MLYIKNGILRDSSKFLETNDGRAVFNAKPELWKENGWVPYTVFLQEEDSSKSQERSLKEMIYDLEEDAKNFKEALLDALYSREEKMYYRQLAEDLQEAGYKEAQIFDNSDEYVNLSDFLNYLQQLSIYEYECKQTLEDHILAINALETQQEIAEYDYTKGYPKVPELKSENIK